MLHIQNSGFAKLLAIDRIDRGGVGVGPVLLRGATCARGVSAVIILDRWFRGKKAELKSTAEGDWVRIEGETEFCVKDGKIISETEYDQRDLQHVYDLLRARDRK